jgi:pyruvate formate lyase activating enzyme
LRRPGCKASPLGWGGYPGGVENRVEIAPGVVRGEFWEPLADGRVRCDVCPRHCRMHDGQRGFCFVREVRDGSVNLTSYGRASGFCIDPIEKKPLNHFYPGTSVLSFGTAGCNLGCRFCQNWDISKARDQDRLTESASPESLAAAAERAGCRSIAFTYNDPVIFLEYATDCAEAAHERGLAAVAVTAGYVTEKARERFFRPMDAANVDLKAFSEHFYEKLCFAKLAPVLDTLAWLKRETRVWLEVTTLLIPGQNDSEAEVDALCSWFVEHLGAETPLHFTAYHPDFKLDAPATPASTLARARRQARALGLKHVYTGNVHDADGQSTYCAGCGETLIGRDWYTLSTYALRDGCCTHCGQRLSGHFAARPGNWGARRMRLPLHEGT